MRRQDTLAALLSGELKASDLPMIACVEWVDAKAGGERRLASLNNRRLWVLKEAERAGVVCSVRVRIKPPAECARLVAKGSRTFRVDRCTLEARLEKERPPPRKEAGGSENGRGAADGEGEDAPVAGTDADSGVVGDKSRG